MTDDWIILVTWVSCDEHDRLGPLDYVSDMPNQTAAAGFAIVTIVRE
jgi:hypothetical protein